MTKWVNFDLYKMVLEVLNYEFNYYCQIHGMSPKFMHIEHYQNLKKPDFLINLDEKYKIECLSKVKKEIECSYYYSCKMGMDSEYMNPEKIMSHIESLLRMKPTDAFENINITKQNLFALKLDKELPKKSEISNKKSKI